MPRNTDRHGTALVIGASRNLGLALARELAARGWDVIGTVRGAERGPLHELADAGRAQVEHVDITDPDSIAGLRDRLQGRDLDLLFVNAGITRGNHPVAEVGPDTFSEVLLTNAYWPMQVVDVLGGLVVADGTIAVMSSRQGSIEMNTRGGQDVYRASKSALNQLMRCHAARDAEDPRTLMLVHPGWVQTELGGPGAPLTVDESVPGVVDQLEAHAGRGGLHFVGYDGAVLPW